MEKPGPSATLFAAPFYSCARNFYVDATNGSDTNPGTQDSPWQNIQTADASVQAGDCVNVQPGTYTAATNITRGGNAPTPTGYVVYRCTELNACQITAAGFARGGFKIAGPNGVGPGFVVIDGFELAANGYYTYSVGIPTMVSENRRDLPSRSLGPILGAGFNPRIGSQLGEFWCAQPYIT